MESVPKILNGLQKRSVRFTRISVLRKRDRMGSQCNGNERHRCKKRGDPSPPALPRKIQSDNGKIREPKL